MQFCSSRRLPQIRWHLLQPLPPTPMQRLISQALVLPWSKATGPDSTRLWPAPRFSAIWTGSGGASGTAAAGTGHCGAVVGHRTGIALRCIEHDGMPSIHGIHQSVMNSSKLFQHASPTGAYSTFRIIYGHSTRMLSRISPFAFIQPEYRGRNNWPLSKKD